MLKTLWAQLYCRKYTIWKLSNANGNKISFHLRIWSRNSLQSQIKFIWNYVERIRQIAGFYVCSLQTLLKYQAPGYQALTFAEWWRVRFSWDFFSVSFFLLSAFSKSTLNSSKLSWPSPSVSSLTRRLFTSSLDNFFVSFPKSWQQMEDWKVFKKTLNTI